MSAEEEYKTPAVVEPESNPAELRAVRKHQQYLSIARKRPVSLEEASNDWQAHYATQWRKEHQQQVPRQMEQCLAAQREEILKHKWIESEKAHRDLGSDAVLDWIRNYAAEWRDWYEHQQEAQTP